MKKQLFEILFRVHPACEHPQFDNFNFGLLHMWLYSTNEQSALDEGLRFFERLPYKLISAKSFNADENQDLLKDFQVDGALKAAQIGFSIELVTWPLDAIEDQVLANWPAILPPLPA